MEVALIRAALPEVNFDLHHIGSTSVVGMIAKPILDIAMQAPEGSETRIAEALVGIGYIDRGRRSGRLFIRFTDGDVRTHNLHLYRFGDPDCLNHIVFRDALRSDTNLRGRYVALKQDLVERLGDAGRRDDAFEKTDFVNAVLNPQAH